MPCSALSFSAAASARGTMSASARMVASLPGRAIAAVPSESTISPSGTSPLVAYSDLCSKKITGSGSRTAAASKPDDVARIRRRHHLQPRDHHAPVLDALRMLRAEARARAVAGAHHQRAFELAVRHVTALREFVGDVVEAHREEIREHDLGDRLEPRHRRAHGGAEDRLLGNRRVAHAHRTEFLQQANGSLEHAAGAGDVLAQEHDVLVALHLLRDAAGDGIAIRQFRHAKPPSA